MNELKILNINEAMKEILQNLEKKGYRAKIIHPINENRYAIVKGDDNQINLLILFKRELFMKFGEMFKRYGESGIGETINCEDLTIAINNDVKRIYTSFPDGKIYFVDFKEFMDNSYKWTTKEGKDVRSASIHKFKRLSLEGES